MKALWTALFLAAVAAVLVRVWTPYSREELAVRTAKAYIGYYQDALAEAEERSGGTEQEQAWYRYLRAFENLEPEPSAVYRHGEGGPGWTILFPYKQGDPRPRSGSPGVAVAMDRDCGDVHRSDEEDDWKAAERP